MQVLFLLMQLYYPVKYKLRLSIGLGLGIGIY